MDNYNDQNGNNDSGSDNLNGYTFGNQNNSSDSSNNSKEYQEVNVNQGENVNASNGQFASSQPTNQSNNSYSNNNGYIYHPDVKSQNYQGSNYQYGQKSEYTPNPDFIQPYRDCQTGYHQNTIPPKKHGSFTTGAVVAIALVCAIVGGSASAAVTSHLVQKNNGSNSTISNYHSSLNVDKTFNSEVSAIAAKVSPSVVGIRVTAQVSGGFFGETQEAKGEGSGVIYSDDGYIITNYHVVSYALGKNGLQSDSAKLQVFLNSSSDTPYDAKIVGYDSNTDLAVIKVEQNGLVPIEIADSDAISVGDTAVAVGSPGGLDFMGSVSKGIVSGLNRNIQIENTVEMKLIQTDAAINPGNSGGALVDGQGKLIGINSSKIASTDIEGMGFAIPSNTVLDITKQIIENKMVKHPFVGIETNLKYTADVLKKMGYPAGVVVSSVMDGSPAQKAMLNTNDIITKLNDVETPDFKSFEAEKNKYKPGDTVKLTIYRNGSTVDVNLTLGESGGNSVNN